MHVVHVPVFVAGAATTTVPFKSREYVNPAFIKSYIKLSLGSAMRKQRKGKGREGRLNFTRQGDESDGTKTSHSAHRLPTACDRMAQIRGTREKERKQATRKAGSAFLFLVAVRLFGDPSAAECALPFSLGHFVRRKWVRLR